MDDEASSNTENVLLSEIESIKSEMEPVEHRKSSTTRTEPVAYRPTYRAVLAKRGFLTKQTLGSGSYSKVKFAVSLNINSKPQVAVKIIDRAKAPKDFQARFLPRELSIWPKMKHANITRMLEMFEDNHRVYMILSYAENGDVLRYIQRSGAIKETLARVWIRQVCDAVRYLHDQDITHRDLKLENLLLDSSYNVKICDFGFVKDECMKDLSKTYCGSKSYASPEILRGEPYDPKKSDIWAIGVILYIFVTGKMPFDESKGNHGVLEEQKKLNFPWHKFKNVTPEGKSLILWLFQSNYQERPDIHIVMSTEWMLEDVVEEDPTDKQAEDYIPGQHLQNDYNAELVKEFAEAYHQKSKSKSNSTAGK